MKVTIDRAECISCGICWSACPEIFEEAPDDGKSRITERYREAGDIASGDVPEDLRASAVSAAEGCPVGCIHPGQ